MERAAFKQRVLRALWVPFAVGIVLAAVLLLELRFLVNRSARVEQSDQAIALSLRIYQTRVDQETELRAYILTADKQFLKPFYQSRQGALELDPVLRRLISDNPGQVEGDEKAIRAFRAWSSWADQAMAMVLAGKDAASLEFQLRGKMLMDKYRDAQRMLIEREQQLRDERAARSRRAVDYVNVSILMLVGLVGLLYAVFGRRELSSVSRSFARALDQSEANAAEARIERDRLHTTLNSIGDAVIATDAEGLVTLMNPVAEKLTGWTLAEASGTPLCGIFRIVNQETREPVENPVDKVRRLKGIVGLANHTILIARDGRDIAIDDSGAPIFGPEGSLIGVILVFRDVTDARKTEARLAEQAALLDQVWDAIIVRDEAGPIRYWNRGAEELYGWSREEALGKDAHELLQTQYTEPLTEIIRRARRHRRWQGELIHTCKNGSQVTVLSRWAVPGYKRREFGSLIEINTDITLRKQLEAAMQSNERLALAGQLSASIAHEIHNPLDTVTNLLFLIEQQIGAQPEIRQLIRTAQEEVLRVTEISRNMLSLFRESRDPVQVNITQLITGVILLIEETIGRDRRAIDFVPGFGGEIEAFSSQLRQVFTNVIKNAVEATTDEGKIVITSEPASELNREGVLVRIVDNGVGIPADLQSQLFNPFVSTKTESGTGLGLWVSRSIVEKHGGIIRVDRSESVGDRGTIVSIFLPLKIAGKESAPQSH